MSKHRGVGTTLLVVGILVLGLGWASTTLAKSGKTVPTINDVLGVWQVQRKAVEYDMSSAEAGKWGDNGTCTITKIDPGTVNLHFVMSGDSWDIPYWCTTGAVLVSASSDSERGCGRYV